MSFVVGAGRWFLATVCAALLGELIFLSSKKLSTYKLQPKSALVRDQLHLPLMLLRNAALHPGAGVTGLVAALEKEVEWAAFATRLRTDPTEMHSEDMAAFAILRCDRVGRHELGEAGAAVR